MTEAGEMLSQYNTSSCLRQGNQDPEKLNNMPQVKHMEGLEGNVMGSVIIETLTILCNFNLMNFKKVFIVVK